MRLVWRLTLWRSFQTRNNSIKKVEIIPLEVVLRNYTAGSFFKNVFGVDEGIALETPIVRIFTIKNDDLDDPFINDEHVKFLKIADDQQIAYFKGRNASYQ